VHYDKQRWASPFSLFANRLLPIVSSSTNRQKTNFCSHNEQEVNRLRTIAWDSVFHLMSPRYRNSAKGKRQLPFVFCKWKTETANFCLFAAHGNRKQMFVFLSRQMMNGNRRLLFQQNVPIYDVKYFYY
jgi:hypothetical protein